MGGSTQLSAKDLISLLIAAMKVKLMGVVFNINPVTVESHSFFYRGFGEH